MRIFEFILEHTEEIILEWEQFARSTESGEQMDKLALRDDVHAILIAIADDIQTAQTSMQQASKSKGEDDPHNRSRSIRLASERHGSERLMSGFEVMELISEYRALRASVIRLWSERRPSVTDQALQDQALQDMTRFNESIDQSMAVALKIYTEQVERSHQMFLAILAHDLRSPLSSIKSGMNLLCRKARTGQEIDSIASQMTISVSAMDHLIADMLDFARTVFGAGIPLTKSNTDLKLLCEEVLNETKLTHSLIDFEYHCNGPNQGKWDRARLRQVLTNLLTNAAEHGDKEQPIIITLHEEDSNIILKLQNKGDPIPKEKLKNLFSPMHSREAAEIKENSGLGLGLGLYIAKQIVIAHGGDIAVESSQSGGTIFTICLPKGQEGDDTGA